MSAWFAQMAPWINLVGLALLSIERWLRRRDVDAALLLRDIDGMKREIDGLHQKASEFGTKQQVYVLEMGSKIAVLESQMAAVHHALSTVKGRR